MYRYSDEDNRELYSDVAELYHRHRPDYPQQLIDHAIESANLQPNSELLEIGCGPGTATLAFASRDLRIHCVEPSTGMIQVAKRVCGLFDWVTFEHATFAESSRRAEPYDAVLAASSFHWANDSNSITRVYESLSSDGALILLWNLPPEPDVAVRQRVAEVTGRASPFFFGEYSVVEHHQHIQEQVLNRIEATNLFESPDLSAETSTRRCTPEEYLGFVATLSPFIRLPKDERQRFFSMARKALDEFPSPLITKNTCLLHVLRRKPI